MSAFELPQTVGKQEIPVELYDGRLDGEPFETEGDKPGYKSRRKKNQDMVDEYLSGVYIEKTQPSLRLLTRLAQGKRTLSGLKQSERRYLRNVIGIKDDKLKLFVAFKQAEKIEPVYPKNPQEIESAPAVQNVEIGNRNYRWL